MCKADVCGEICKTDVQPSRPRPKPEVANLNKKKRCCHHGTTISFVQMGTSIICCPTLPVNKTSILQRFWLHHSQRMQERKEEVGQERWVQLGDHPEELQTVLQRCMPVPAQHCNQRSFQQKHCGGSAAGTAERTRELDTFTGQRLLPCVERKVKFRDTVPENKPLTGAKMMSAVGHRKQSRQRGTS